MACKYASIKQMNDYQKIAVIGKGSFGTIYKVRNLRTGKIEAIKKIDLTALSVRHRREAEREIMFLRGLHHPNILKFHGSFSIDKSLCIVTEFCDLGDLAGFIHSVPGPMPEDLILKIFIQILLGVEYLHKKQIIHRDIKAMNVFIKRPLRVKIGDLGIARHLSESYYASTIIGTPFYLSPELCEEKPYDYKSDVWALGCLLFELCLKEPPFRSTETTSLKSSILKGKYKSVPSIYSKEIRELVDRMLRPDPRDRPSVEDVLCYPFIKRKMEIHGLTANNFTLKMVASNKPKINSPYMQLDGNLADFITGNKHKNGDKKTTVSIEKSSSQQPIRNEPEHHFRISQSQQNIRNSHQFEPVSIMMNHINDKRMAKRFKKIDRFDLHSIDEHNESSFSKLPNQNRPIQRLDQEPLESEINPVNNHFISHDHIPSNERTNHLGINKFQKDGSPKAFQQGIDFIHRQHPAFVRNNVQAMRYPVRKPTIFGQKDAGGHRVKSKYLLASPVTPVNDITDDRREPFTPKLNMKESKFIEDQLTSEHPTKNSKDFLNSKLKKPTKQDMRKSLTIRNTSIDAPEGVSHLQSGDIDCYELLNNHHNKQLSKNERANLKARTHSKSSLDRPNGIHKSRIKRRKQSDRWAFFDRLMLLQPNCRPSFAPSLDKKVQSVSLLGENQ